MPPLPPRRRPRALTLLPFLLAAPLLGGAKCEHLEATGSDDAYIRLPGSQTAAPTDPSAGPLLPLTPGDRWEMAFELRDARAPDKAPLRGRETITVEGPQAVGGLKGTRVTFRQPKNTREEIYLADERGIALLAAGMGERMTITPPLPILRYPVKEGEVTAWNGVLRFRKTTAPGEAYSRVSGSEKIKTEAGEFTAYRVDTTISTTVDGQSLTLPTTRWLAPGVGMVRQRLVAGNQIILKELLKYTPARGKKAAGGGPATPGKNL